MAMYCRSNSTFLIIVVLAVLCRPCHRYSLLKIVTFFTFTCILVKPNSPIHAPVHTIWNTVMNTDERYWAL